MLQTLDRLLTVSSDSVSSSVTLQNLHIQNGNSLGHSLNETINSFNVLNVSIANVQQMSDSALGGALWVFGASLYLENVRGAADRETLA